MEYLEVLVAGKPVDDNHASPAIRTALKRSLIQIPLEDADIAHIQLGHTFRHAISSPWKKTQPYRLASVIQDCREGRMEATQLEMRVYEHCGERAATAFSCAVDEVSLNDEFDRLETRVFQLGGWWARAALHAVEIDGKDIDKTKTQIFEGT